MNSMKLQVVKNDSIEQKREQYNKKSSKSLDPSIAFDTQIIDQIE